MLAGRTIDILAPLQLELDSRVEMKRMLQRYWLRDHWLPAD
jgi:hypothetical protein